LLGQDLHGSSGDFGAADTPGAMVLAGDDPHQDSEEHLCGLEGRVHRLYGV
jgi:hypothetical protein